MKLEGNIKVYEAKDASINLTLNYDFRRLLLGCAVTTGIMRGVVGMRMFVVHIAFLSICFTSFYHVPIPPQQPPPKQLRQRSPTRQYKKGRKGRR
jgi:hypothetical protein